MANRTYWKGHLKLSLVTAKVSLTPANTESARVRFHLLNRETGNRLETRYVDRETHRAVARKNQVKGFPKDDSDDDFVIVEDDEIDSLEFESTRTIDIEAFVPANSIAWIWYDRPHFLRPEESQSVEAFGVIRQAMEEKRVVGIARLVLYGREHAVLLEPCGKGMLLWTLRYGETIRDPVEDRTSAAKSASTKGRKAAALKKNIEKKTVNWKPSLVHDPLQKKLLNVVKELAPTKAKRKTGQPKTGPKNTGKVIDITEALRKSLAQRKEG